MSWDCNMSKQKTLIGVLGLPIRKNDNKTLEFLLTRRHSPQKPSFHNRWQLAGGGLEFGETPEQALVREFKEELCVIPEIIYPRPIVLTSMWRKEITHYSKDIHLVLLTYLVSITTQLPDCKADPETNDLGWFTYDEIKCHDLLPKTLEFVDEALKIIQDYKLDETS